MNLLAVIDEIYEILDALDAATTPAVKIAAVRALLNALVRKLHTAAAAEKTKTA